MSRAMKDSGIPWIGEVPMGWNVSLIGSCIKEVDCKNTDGKEDNALQFKMGTIISKRNGDSKYNPETLEAYNIVKVGDIIINGLNLSFDLISQRVGLVKEDGVITSTYIAVRPSADISNEYLTYLFKAYDNCKAFHSMGRGLRQTLSYGELRKYYVVLPLKEEQQRIAEFLDIKCSEIDETIGLQEEFIEELKAYKQSVITEAVTRGLNPNVKLKDSGIDWIGKIPQGWNIIPFKSFFDTGKGLSFTKADLVPNGVPVISYGQVHSKLNTGTRIDNELIRFVPIELTTGSESSKVRIGDFIFADTSEDIEGCGNSVYVDKEIGLYAGYHSVVAHSKEMRSNSYLAYLFLTDCWRNQIRCRVTGIKVFSVSQSIIRQTTLLLPSPTEQQQIVDYLDNKCAEIDSLIAIKQQKIEELKDYKKSIIYEYVTGKKEI